MEKVERKAWTAEEDNVIRSGREKNTPYEDIAQQLPGRTRSAVSVRAHQLRGIDKAAGGGVAAAPVPTPAQPSLPGTEAAAPKRRGRPPKAKPEGAAAAAPVEKSEAPQAAAETPAPKRRGRPPKAATVETPAPVAAAPVPAPAPVAAPKAKSPRAPRAAAPVAAQAANGNGNGHAHAPAEHVNGNGQGFAFPLDGSHKLSAHGATLKLVPGGVRFDFGGGRHVDVASVPAA